MSKRCQVSEKFSAAGKVDHENAVIHRVKVLGLESINTGRVLGLDRRDFGAAVDETYRYDEQAVREACAVYEGVVVNCDHLESGTGRGGERVVHGQRKVAHRLAQLKNVTYENGMVADLHLLKSNPLTPMVLEMAERMPEHIALSHHAAWLFEPVNGRAVATKCEEATSVDLIAERPGTTRTLFESDAAAKGGHDAFDTEAGCRSLQG